MNKCSPTLVVRRGVPLRHELSRAKAMVLLCVLTLSSVLKHHRCSDMVVKGLANGVNGSAPQKILRVFPSAVP